MNNTAKRSKPKAGQARAIISVFMLLGFATLLVTGLLSYGMRYSSLLSAIHTIFGLTFIAFGVFHLRNNLRPIGMYLKQVAARRWFIVGLVMVPVTVLGVMLAIPPFQTITDFGYALKELRPIDRQATQVLTTRYDVQGRALSIEVKAGDQYAGPGAEVFGIRLTTVPQMAIWVEDTEGNYLETLYVTKKGATGTYIAELFSEEEEIRRPEALPHWSHQRGVAAADGLYVPSKAAPLADAVTGATPLSNYNLNTTLKNVAEKVVVKMEVNRSFDYNETFSKTAFPNDPIYSGSGNTAQPSLIYSAEVDLVGKDRYTILELIGRGHHSGQHGEVISDLAGVTTAKRMVDRVIVDRGLL
jgi:hypothetical protein